jgi:REP element-mobilizing transposase RayT
LTFSFRFYTFAHRIGPEIILKTSKASKSKQLKLFKGSKSEYGGRIANTRAGRAGPRPLDTRNTMHLVLKSSKAKGDWSFLRPKNKARVQSILKRFSKKYGVRVLSAANVGNHLHLHIKLANRFGYTPFIRAVTAAIAMAVTGRSRWSKTPRQKEKFWDLRPFTRAIVGLRGFFGIEDYVAINRLEGSGVSREVARMIVEDRRRPG